MGQNVAVIDYGVGNLYSVCNALKHIGVNAVLTNDNKVISKADRVILPGVGAFSAAMANLTSRGLDDTVKAFVDSGRPFLGICVGMQLLMEISSESGLHTGLGLVSGQVQKLPSSSIDGQKLKIPHVGWTLVEGNGLKTGAYKNIDTLFPKDEYFYFVHSYACYLGIEDETLATSYYGGRKITASIKKDNIIGVQFHPERSGHVGLSFLRRFLSL